MGRGSQQEGGPTFENVEDVLILDNSSFVMLSDVSNHVLNVHPGTTTQLLLHYAWRRNLAKTHCRLIKMGHQLVFVWLLFADFLPSSALDDELRFHFDCAFRCGQMTESDREAINSIYRSAGCGSGGPGSHPVCASSMEQLCVGSCGGGQQDMATFLPGAFGNPEPVPAESFEEALKAHESCASRCVTEGLSWQQCPLKVYKKLLDQKQLHDGRYQVYLPFTKPFSSRENIGVSDLVLEVLTKYFKMSGKGFGIDHVTVLTSSSGSGNQSLHPDVHYFKGLSVSVHTALQDVPLEMGPTFFCPCTGESLFREEWPASAAIKMKHWLQNVLRPRVA
eukprot:g7246.t1